MKRKSESSSKYVMSRCHMRLFILIPGIIVTTEIQGTRISFYLQTALNTLQNIVKTRTYKENVDPN